MGYIDFFVSHPSLSDGDSWFFSLEKTELKGFVKPLRKSLTLRLVSN